MKYLAFIFIAISTASASPLQGRIWGGSSAAPGQFPYMASLNEPAQLCDAVIIDTRWVLTSAHCIDFAHADAVILAGTTFQNSGGTRHKVSKLIKHENFSWSTLKDDIALIQVEDEFEFGDLVQPIGFGDPEANSTCVAAGWGTTQDMGYAEELQFVEVRALSNEDCSGYDAALMYLGPEEICAVGSLRKGVCNGDSGGPLVCGGKLAGLVSYGTGPCGQGFPDVYVRPSAYVDWINENMK